MYSASKYTEWCLFMPSGKGAKRWAKCRKNLDRQRGRRKVIA